MSKSPSFEAETAIVENAERIARLSTDLSNRIVGLESWLSALPSKVEAVYWPPELKPKQPNLALKFGRMGGVWGIQYAPVVTAKKYEPEWLQLKTASLQIKIAAIPLLPYLLAEIEGAQNELTQALERAHYQFNGFMPIVAQDRKERP